MGDLGEFEAGAVDCRGNGMNTNKPAASVAKAIGGYFELELYPGTEYHTDAIRLNTGRNALEYILRARGYRKVYLPYYTCEAVLEPIRRIGVQYQFYHIDVNLDPRFDLSAVQEDEGFVYTNYFGLKDTRVDSLARMCTNLIVDNAQAFFSKPTPNADVFYSPRKFFGVPDGAYLYTDRHLSQPLEQDRSEGRFQHLLLRAEYGPEEGFRTYRKTSEAMGAVPLRIMSNLTRRMLAGIDYGTVATKRRCNFAALHERLRVLNNLDLDLDDRCVPMVYPLVTDRPGVRERLIANRIYVAQYWPSVVRWTKCTDIEYNLATNLIPLPVDQRYSLNDMERITTIVEDLLQ